LARAGYAAAIEPYRWTFAATPLAVGEARSAAREAARFAGADRTLLASVALCVTEAMTNAVLHAYRDAAQVGEVEVELSAEDGRLDICVRDHGSGLRSRDDSPGAGFGLAILDQLTSELTVTSGSDGVGTQVSMRFEFERIDLDMDR
jgi:serine/threonine-protein kinase RsbW